MLSKFPVGIVHVSSHSSVRFHLMLSNYDVGPRDSRALAASANYGGPSKGTFSHPKRAR